jgi:coniferyl-aldehyde dehydrogenase
MIDDADPIAAAFAALPPEDSPPDRRARDAHLAALARETRRHAEEAARAVSRDYGHRPRPETLLAEVAMVLEGVRHARRNLRRWMRPERAPLPYHLWPSSAHVTRVPLGRVGIIGPWNYPLQLTLLPLVAAISGGNRAILHPSEHTPETAALVARIAAAALPGRVVTLAPSARTAAALAAAPLDGLFFTGSTATGRRVAEAAARNLVPVTLELGGKSPAILLDGADLDAAARSIIAGKLLNAGQTCVAPDYLMVPRAQVEPMLAALRRATAALYPDPSGPDYAAIARAPDRDRLAALLHGARAEPLMERMPAPPRMGGWALVDPAPDHPAMRDEIFGPVLPILLYDDPEETRAFVRARPCPLALYVYGPERAARALAEATPSGGAVVNEAVVHVGVQSLAFGGAGESGIGAYHGAEGFRAFTRPRALMVARPSLARLVRPPYGRNIERILASLIR